jgi:3-deoxy-7-phosphoheptulonate synthase
MEYRTDDLRIKEIKELLPPAHLLREFSITQRAAETVYETRQAIHRILHGTEGNIRIALDAIRAAQVPHHFLSVTKGGHSAIVSTTGNEDCHVILRGGKQPNYDAASVDAAAKGLAEAGIPARLMIDFSHGNSGKEPQRQVDVGREVATQIARGDGRIFGVMVESHLKAGRQDLVPGKELVYGLSITDACIGWEDSRRLLDTLADAVRKRRLKEEVEAEAE